VNFYDALKKVAQRRGVRRAEWPEGSVVMLVPDADGGEGRLLIQVDAASKPTPWLISESDMAATDWWLVGLAETSPSPSPTPAPTEGN